MLKGQIVKGVIPRKDEVDDQSEMISTNKNKPCELNFKENS
jgi:hypothetical protein